MQQSVPQNCHSVHSLKHTALSSTKDSSNRLSFSQDFFKLSDLNCSYVIEVIFTTYKMSIFPRNQTYHLLFGDQVFQNELEVDSLKAF